MQINRSTDYALRAMTFLATQPDQVSMVNEIALDQGVPPKFLARILQMLHKAGLVESHRGIRGGFRLARPAHQVNVLHVMEAVEGPLTINFCLTSPSICDQSERCPSLAVWERAQAAFMRVLASTTIADLATEQQRRDHALKLPKLPVLAE
ncbi:Rrf2 family transcriptional regulator [Candidatus Cyanaurora vandensis]|uniref:RrF2 family transcriptional regulator n=1 Tax=Candidatus Cyanaurora vandensis TaxID=2714958 RepID=UPI0025803BC6|nr:Rrf2 family transcriptional regulator [Candidatus Cyanaurora vandensis]